MNINDKNSVAYKVLKVLHQKYTDEPLRNQEKKISVVASHKYIHFSLDEVTKACHYLKRLHYVNLPTPDTVEINDEGIKYFVKIKTFNFTIKASFYESILAGLITNIIFAIMGIIAMLYIYHFG